MKRAALIASFVVALAGGAAAQPLDDEAPTHGSHQPASAAEHGDHGVPHGAPHANFTDFGWSSKDSAGGTLETGEETMAPPFVLALLNFAVLLALLGKFAVPKIRTFVRDRHDEIVNALDEAARLRDDARRKMDEIAVRVAGVDAEVDRLVAEIRAQAEAEKARILADARAQAEALEREAEQRIAAETVRARLAIEREVVAAAIAAAEKILRAQTTEVDHRNLVQQFITSLEAPPPAREREPS